MKSEKKFLLAAVSSVLQFGKGGPKIKNNSGDVQIRNAADNAYANLEALNITASNTVIANYLQSDNIVEKTGAAGVTIDGVLVKDGLVDGKDVSTLATDSAVVHNTGAESVAGLKTFTDGIATDTIAEETSAAGVTVDGVLIKDGLVDGKDVSTLATDSAVVHNTGDETIAGIKTFSNNVIISGNLQVDGTQVVVNSETLTINDNLIVLNNNVSGTPTENSGIEVERGTSTNAQVLFNETSDKWQFGLVGDLKDVADDATVVHLAGTETVTGDKTFSGAVKVDTISERTSAAGVTVDGVLLKDNKMGGSYLDINSMTAETSISDSDEIIIYDVSNTANRKMTKANLFAGFAQSTGALKCIQITLGTTDASSSTSIPVGAVVMRTYLDVTTAYSAGATVQIIVDGTSDEEIMGTGDNDVQATSVYSAEPHASITTATSGVVKAVVAGSPSVGAAKIRVEYYESFLG